MSITIQHDIVITCETQDDLTAINDAVTSRYRDDLTVEKTVDGFVIRVQFTSEPTRADLGV